MPSLVYKSCRYVVVYFIFYISIVIIYGFGSLGLVAIDFGGGPSVGRVTN